MGFDVTFGVGDAWKIWVLFAQLCVVAMLIASFGSKLSIIGDKIAEESGLSGTWIGVILLAVITSVPEVIVSLTAAFKNNPDIAMGNVFGSNSFNMVIIALVDFLQGPGPVMLTVGTNQIVTAALGVFLMASGCIGIIASRGVGAENESFSGISPNVGFVFSLLILITWGIGMLLTFRMEKESLSDEEYKRKSNPKVLRKLWIKFALFSLGLIASATWLVFVAEKIAITPINFFGTHIILGFTFVGATIVAALTSLPEVVVSISAYRIGAVNMSVANVLGSNAFNVMILSLVDITNLIRGKPSIFASVGLIHIMPALLAMMLTSIATIGVMYRSRESVFYLGWDAILILAIYLLGGYIFFLISTSIV